MKKKMLKKELGVTLVALIVTVIVLLILSGIVLSLVVGQGGIINIAQQAGKNHIYAEQQEKNELDKLYSSMMIATNDSSQITISMQDLKTLIQTEVEQQLENKGVNTPTGAILAQMGNNTPRGYLPCDGNVYNISQYQTLADYIKTEFGSYNYFGGDGETTFAVPDLRGEFLRGTGTATRDTGTGENVGVHQDATRIPYVWSGSGGLAIANYNISPAYRDTSEVANTKYLSVSVSQQSTARSQTQYYTVRTTNTSVLYCIKY